MGPSDNSTTPEVLFLYHNAHGSSHPGRRDGNAYLYILIVVSFYGVFLCGIMLCYFRSKRREKRRINVFTRLVHEEEQREWGALPRKPSLPFPAVARGAPPPAVPHAHGPHDGRALSPLACALCTEQSSVSSLCSSSADTHFAIEEEEVESDSGTAGSDSTDPRREER